MKSIWLHLSSETILQQNSAEENSLQRPTMETGLNENKNPNKETSLELPWNLKDMLIEINRAIVLENFFAVVFWLLKDPIPVSQ